MIEDWTFLGRARAVEGIGGKGRKEGEGKRG